LIFSLPLERLLRPWKVDAGFGGQPLDTEYAGTNAPRCRGIFTNSTNCSMRCTKHPPAVRTTGPSPKQDNENSGMPIHVEPVPSGSVKCHLSDYGSVRISAAVPQLPCCIRQGPHHEAQKSTSTGTRALEQFRQLLSRLPAAHPGRHGVCTLHTFPYRRGVPLNAFFAHKPCRFELRHSPLTQFTSRMFKCL